MILLRNLMFLSFAFFCLVELTGIHGTQTGTIERWVSISETEHWNPKQQCLVDMIHYALLLSKDKTVGLIFSEVTECVVVVGTGVTPKSLDVICRWWLDNFNLAFFCLSCLLSHYVHGLGLPRWILQEWNYLQVNSQQGRENEVAKWVYCEQMKVLTFLQIAPSDSCGYFVCH